jgi:hypothetical protein
MTSRTSSRTQSVADQLQVQQSETEQISETKQISESEQLVQPKIKNKSPSKQFDDIKHEWNVAHENLSKSFQELTGIFAQINYLLEQLEFQLGALEKDSGISDIVTAHKKAMTGMSGLVGGVGEANIHLEKFEKNNLNKLTPDTIKILDKLKREMTNATRVFNGIKVGASVPTMTQNGQRVQIQRQARNGTGVSFAESEASDSSSEASGSSTKSKTSERSKTSEVSKTSDSSGDSSETSKTSKTSKTSDSSGDASETSETSERSKTSERSEFSERSKTSENSENSENSKASKTSSSEANKRSSTEDDESVASIETIEASDSNGVGEIEKEQEENIAGLNDGSARSTEGERKISNNIFSNSENNIPVKEVEDLVNPDEVSDQPGGGTTQSTEDEMVNQVNTPQNIGNNDYGDSSDFFVQTSEGTIKVGDN